MTDRPDQRVVDEADGRAAAIGLGPEAGYGDGPGLDLPDGLGREEWLELGRRLGARQERDRWALGDWAAHGDRRYGDLTEAGAEIGLARKTLYHLAGVARKIELSRRRDNLSWDHHAAVAALSPTIADSLLDRAAAEGWSREVIREEARAASTEARLEARVAELERDLECARADRDEAEHRLRRLEDAAGESARALLREWGEIDLATATFFDPTNPHGARALHGNKALKAAARIHRRLKKQALKINEIAVRIDARLTVAAAPKGTAG